MEMYSTPLSSPTASSSPPLLHPLPLALQAALLSLMIIMAVALSASAMMRKFTKTRYLEAVNYELH